MPKELILLYIHSGIIHSKKYLLLSIMEQKFTNIYDKQIWKNGSGVGSSIKYNRMYMDFLSKFLIDNSIKNVLDIGCGDWQFSQNIDWNQIDYNGIDIVKSVVDTNNDKFGKENIKFFHLNPLETKLPGSFDLVIIKDVLQHWSNETIIEFLDKLITQGNKYIIIVNTAFSTFKNNTNKGINRSIKNRYHYAKLDAADFPLNKYNPQILGTYKFKQISIIQ